jgi:hypothetical protein
MPKPCGIELESDYRDVKHSIFGNGNGNTFVLHQGVNRISDPSGTDSYQFNMNEMQQNTILDSGGNGGITVIRDSSSHFTLTGTASYLSDSAGKTREGAWHFSIFTLERGSESDASFTFGGKSGSSLRITPNGGKLKQLKVA